ncbi:MAG: hypothetical protein ACREPW_04255, partial [Candidatus Binataceae bacterium]
MFGLKMDSSVQTLIDVATAPASAERQSPFRFTPRRVTDAEFLFAALLGLAAVMVRQRIGMVYSVWRSDLWLYLPLLAYQDVIALTVLAWAFYGIFVLVRSSRVRRRIARAGWYFLLLLALYTSIDTVIFSYIHTEATYKLFILSDNLHMVEKSIPDALGGGGPYLWVVIGILTLVLVTESLARLAPDYLRRLRARFYSPLALVLIIVYVVGAHAWAQHDLS